MPHLGMIYTIMTAENKLLADSARKRGAGLEQIEEDELLMQISKKQIKEYSAILQRSSSFSRSLYSTAYFEEAETPVINALCSQQICGDKALTTLKFAKNGVPTPKTYLAYTKGEALKAATSLGYPVVVKPVVGSWARLVNKASDEHALEAIIEAREQMGSPMQKIYYIQEYIEKPGRDIRAFFAGRETICAIYRSSNSWITNTGRGGTASKCELTQEIRELCAKAVNAVTEGKGEGVFGVDLMEGKDGLVVHEINHTVEFRNSIKPTGADIPGKIIEYLMEVAKR